MLPPFTMRLAMVALASAPASYAAALDPAYELDSTSVSLDGAATACVDAPASCAPATLIQASELAAQLDTLQVLDARPTVKFTATHVPGALAIDATALRSMVSSFDPDAEAAPSIAAALGKAGVVRDRPLVVYADASDLAAARLLWTLEYMGQRDVRLLDGGFAAWQAGGWPTRSAAEEPTASEAPYPSDRLERGRRVGVRWVEANLKSPHVTFVDARTPAEFAAGHIPGAVNIDWTLNVADGRLKPRTALESLHAGVPRSGTVIAYCQTGYRASMAYFVLRYLNYPDVRLYDGSMAEWSADPSRPQERGVLATTR